MFNNQRICMPFVRILAILFTIMWSGSMLFGQTRTVTGQVIDQATGEPVIGANVLVKGTTTGTITDLDGNFSISGVTDKSVLHVSFVGYTAEDVPVKGNTKLNIVIREDNDLLEEVVVVGYGVQKKRDLTGAIAVGEEAASLPSRESAKAFCKFAADRLRCIFIIQQGFDALKNDDDPQLSAWAAKCRKTFPRVASGHLDRALSLIDRNVNLKILFTDLVDRLYMTI